jgi:hypothetical protein
MSDPIVPSYSPILLGKMGLSPHDDEGSKEYPTLLRLLMPLYNDKKRLIREAGSFRVSVDGSLFRVSFECPTEGIQTTMMTPTIMELLTSLEVHLSDPQSDWPQTYAAKKRARRGLDKSIE